VLQQGYSLTCEQSEKIPFSTGGFSRPVTLTIQKPCG
jgi:hypothetical protein